MTWLMVALGAAVGAPARYLTDRAVQSQHQGVMPWGTVSVNVVGSLILGVLTGLGPRCLLRSWRCSGPGSVAR